MREAWAALRSRWSRPIVGRADLATLVMGYIATVTAGTGFSYLLPADTFGLSPSFRVMRELGGETFWGVAIWTVGTLALVATWLEWHAAALERAHLTTTRPERMPSRRFGRIVWNLVSILWFFIACTLIVSVPFSPGAIAYGCLAILAQIIATTARQRRDEGLKGGDDAGA